MVKNPNKFLCCRFLSSFIGLDRAQSTIVVYSFTEELTSPNLSVTQFMQIVGARNKRLCTVVDQFQHKSSHLCFSSVMFAGLHNHFPLKTLALVEKEILIVLRNLFRGYSYEFRTVSYGPRFFFALCRFMAQKRPDINQRGIKRFAFARVIRLITCRV